MPSAEFLQGFAEGSEGKKFFVAFDGQTGDMPLPESSIQDSEWSLGARASLEYRGFANGTPRKFRDVPTQAVQLGPNGKLPVAENQLEEYLDNPYS